MSHPVGILSRMTADMAKLNRITRRQRALITRVQALGAGLTDSQITSRLRTGVWIEVRPGVYAVAGAPESWEQKVLAVLLSAGPGSYASHATAAYLWGIRGVTQPDRIEVVVPIPAKVRLAGVGGHRSRELFDADLTTRLGMPCVSPARALVDSTRTLPRGELGRAIDDLVRRKLCTFEEMRLCVARLHPGPGRPLRVIHQELAKRLPGYSPGDTDLETRALRALADAGLPLPRQQYRMTLGGRRVRIDLAYPAERIAIEVDSWEFHGGEQRAAFDRDAHRRDDLLAIDWAPLTYTSAMSDDYFVDRVRTLLQRAWARDALVPRTIAHSGAA